MDFVRGDMCCWGKCDAVSGLPYLKPTGFAVNKGILAEQLSCRCRGGHEHERIQRHVHYDNHVDYHHQHCHRHYDNHHVGHHHFLAMRTVLQELEKLGCTRPAAVVDAVIDERAKHAWTGVFR